MHSPEPGADATKTLEEFSRQIDLPSAHSPLFQIWWDARKRLSDPAWDLHISNAYSHYRSSHPDWHESPVVRTGVYDQGRLSAEESAALLGLFAGCPAISYSADDFCDGYTFDVSGSLADYNTYRRMTSPFEAKLSEVLREIAPAVEVLCGHYWRIVSSHIWSLNPGPRKYQWHLDGWPPGLKKLFIFPGGVDESRGSTAFRLKTGEEKVISGPPGTWMIFENSIVEHKGFESLTESRPTIAISIAPAFRTDFTLFDAGVNSGYPWFPIEDPRSASEYTSGDFYDPIATNARRLKDVLQGAGLGALLTEDGRVKDPAALRTEPTEAPSPVIKGPSVPPEPAVPGAPTKHGLAAKLARLLR